MATITMDASEHDALRENIRLLKESKTREQELSNEIKKLQQEAIDKLVDAEKSVAVINKTLTQQRVCVKRSRCEILDNIKYFISRASRGYPSNVQGFEFEDALIDAFFSIKEENIVSDVSVTTKGFDDVKKEVKEEYLKELCKNTQKELKNLTSLEDKIKKLTFENLRLKDVESKLQQCHEERLKNSSSAFEANSKLYEITSLLKNSWNILNYITIKEKIKSIIYENKNKI